MHRCHRMHVLLVMSLVIAFETRASETSEKQEVLAPIPDDVIKYILSKVKCENPEYVCRKVGFDNPARYDEPGASWHYSKTDFSTQDLGDGTTCYVFEPVGGNGSFAAAVPNYHFVLRDGKMSLIFDGNSRYSRYLERKPMINGRYTIRQMWRGFGRHVDECVRIEKTWFWDGRRYVWIQKVRQTDSMRDGKSQTDTVWNPKTKAAFLSAPRTWTHSVSRYDTLTRIARNYETHMTEIVRQNNIKNPDVIRDGQQLTYDSRKVTAKAEKKVDL